MKGKAEGWGGLSLRHERISSPLSKDAAARSGASTPHSSQEVSLSTCHSSHGAPWAAARPSLRDPARTQNDTRSGRLCRSADRRPRAPPAAGGPSLSCSNHMASGADAQQHGNTRRSEGAGGDRAALEPGRVLHQHRARVHRGHRRHSKHKPSSAPKGLAKLRPLAGLPHPLRASRAHPGHMWKRCPMGWLRRLCRESSPRPGPQLERPARPGPQAPGVTASPTSPHLTAP